MRRLALGPLRTILGLALLTPVLVAQQNPELLPGGGFEATWPGGFPQQWNALEGPPAAFSTVQSDLTGVASRALSLDLDAVPPGTELRIHSNPFRLTSPDRFEFRATFQALATQGAPAFAAEAYLVRDDGYVGPRVLSHGAPTDLLRGVRSIRSVELTAAEPHDWIVLLIVRRDPSGSLRGRLLLDELSLRRAPYHDADTFVVISGEVAGETIGFAHRHGCAENFVALSFGLLDRPLEIPGQGFLNVDPAQEIFTARQPGIGPLVIRRSDVPAELRGRWLYVQSFGLGCWSRGRAATLSLATRVAIP